MTTRNDWADYLDPEQDNPQLPAHDRERLDRIGEVLADSATWDGPPRHLRDRLLAQARAEAAATGPAQAPNPAGPVEAPRATEPVPARSETELEARRRRRSHSAGPRRARWWVPALATAAAGIALAVLLWPQAATLPTHQLSGTALAPNATAAATLETKSAGIAITLNITGLGPAGPGNYYAAWMRGPQGTVPLGSFHWKVGGIPIDLWSGVDPNLYPELFVTLQRESDGPEPSDQVVLTGQVNGSG
ncbi:MAG: anti-sigma factor [Sporichthyaceae bacterium]|nr:anti-sigma factor [Sporichthyaceae bacterium]